jgi:RecA/RadA recombinase
MTVFFFCLQESLKQCLFVRLPQLLTQRSVKLVVIDSIAGLFRSEYDPGDAVNRAKELQMVGGQLHKLAEQFRLAVICVNQVPFSHKYLAVFCQSWS